VLESTDDKLSLKGGVVNSREPIKLWWASNISLEQLIVSGAVNLVDSQCDKLVTVLVTSLSY